MTTVEAEAVVDQYSQPSTGDLWRSENALPSRPVLVMGDEEAFQRDLEAARQRARQRIRQCENERRRIIPLELWPEWWFDVEVWS